MTAPKLAVELIPSTSWFRNLRSMLRPSEWDRVRRDVYERAGYRCQVCGGIGTRHPVECHEQWRFDLGAGVQTLVGLIALCPDCHRSIHFGLAEVMGLASEAEAHLRRVNGWTEDETSFHIVEAIELWEQRNAVDWRLDFGWLEREFGVQVRKHG